MKEATALREGGAVAYCDGDVDEPGHALDKQGFADARRAEQHDIRLF